MLILSRFWYGLMVLGSYIRLNREGRLLVLSTSNTNISGYKNVVEKAMATYSSILAWRIPIERGAWWATVHRVTKSQTRLKWLSTQAQCLSLSLKTFLGLKSALSKIHMDTPTFLWLVLAWYISLHLLLIYRHLYI